MILTEAELLEVVDAADVAFLLEPPWVRKYPPLGLARLARRLRENGSEVRFGRSFDGGPADVVLVASVFTYDLAVLAAEVQTVRAMAPDVRVIIGGPAATLVPDAVQRTTGADVFAGVSPELDELAGDLSLDWQVEGVWKDFAFAFTTRGCPNRCPYCAVWRIEKEPRIVPTWREQLTTTKPNAMLGDNNLTSWGAGHLREVVELLEERGTALCIDSGVDVKHIDDEVAELLARVKWSKRGLRVAFDRIEEDGVFQEAVGRLLDAGVEADSIVALSLFGYRDTPVEADYRMREIVRLGIHGFPQRFTPLRALSVAEVYAAIGKHWTPALSKHFRNFWIYRGKFAGKEVDDFGAYLEKTLEAPTGREKLTAADLEVWKAGLPSG